MLCSLLHRIIHSIYVLSAEVITVISIDMVWEANRSFHSSIGLLFRLNGSHLKEHPWTIVNGTKDPPRGAIILLTPSGLRSFGRLLCRSSVKDHSGYSPSSLRASSQNTQQRRYTSHGLGALIGSHASGFHKCLGHAIDLASVPPLRVMNVETLAVHLIDMIRRQ